VTRRALVAGLVLTAPLVVLAVLLARPRLDAEWENQPAHFWLVLAAAAAAFAVGFAISEAARRRRDARLYLVSLAFLASAGFLGLHALATPGVLLEGPNTGFVIATPVGLAVAAAFAAASALEFGPDRSRAVMRRERLLRNGLIGILALWAAVSLAGLPPLDDPLPAEQAAGPLRLLAAVGVLLYAAAALGYLNLARRRPGFVVFAVALAFALLAEAMIVIAFARNWHLSWWHWHVLMLLGFAFVAYSARREWHEERFSPLYLEHVLRGSKDVSVLFADLQGYTPFTERHEPAQVADMLNRYFEGTVPIVMERHGGDVFQLIGDAIMVVFNKEGDQPDHAERAARAALDLQREASAVAADHPDWPRFRVGVNSGEVAAAVMGARGKRQHGIVGDTVNLAARLEGQARPEEVVIGHGTYERLPPGVLVERLPELRVKGKEAPVQAYVLRGLANGEEER
jgi:adenylate cyclase